MRTLNKITGAVLLLVAMGACTSKNSAGWLADKAAKQAERSIELTESQTLGTIPSIAERQDKAIGIIKNDMLQRLQQGRVKTQMNWDEVEKYFEELEFGEEIVKKSDEAVKLLEERYDKKISDAGSKYIGKEIICEAESPYSNAKFTISSFDRQEDEWYAECLISCSASEAVSSRWSKPSFRISCYNDEYMVLYSKKIDVPDEAIQAVTNDYGNITEYQLDAGTTFSTTIKIKVSNLGDVDQVGITR